MNISLWLTVLSIQSFRDGDLFKYVNQTMVNPTKKPIGVTTENYEHNKTS